MPAAAWGHGRLWRTAEVLATPSYCLLVMCISMPGPRLPVGPLARRFLCTKMIQEDVDRLKHLQHAAREPHPVHEDQDDSCTVMSATVNFG